jgi:hypothetical protein
MHVDVKYEQHPDPVVQRDRDLLQQSHLVLCSSQQSPVTPVGLLTLNCDACSRQ